MLILFRRRLLEQEKDAASERFHQQYKQTVEKNYVPLYPHLFDPAQFAEVALVDSFREALKLNTPAALCPILTKVHHRIYSFDMLKPSYCKELIEEIEHYEEWIRNVGLQINRPNSMNKYGAILDDFGFAPVLDEVVKSYIAPLSSYLYPHIGAHLDSHHGFVVEYKIGKDTKLDFHADDAEVTLNVCLGKEFTGGELFFGGIRCDIHQQQKPHPQEGFVLHHQPGVGVLHLGRHRHLAQQITSGERHNLIIWCRSSLFRQNRNPRECQIGANVFA